MKNRWSRRSRRSIMLGVGASLLTGVGFCMGLAAAVAAGWFTAPIVEIPVHASATDSSDKFVVATGPVETGLEGVFFLDSLSGDLQCTVFNPRTGNFNAVFRRKVLNDLSLAQDKRPRFLMVTGLFTGRRVSGTTQPSGCIVYVVDANSGKYAAYGVPWNSQAALRGQSQVGDLVLLQAGNVRTAAVRE